MTTVAENEALTRVGAGTPMGEVLRRYWWPVGISADLKEKPTLIRLLGEDLVLYRDRQRRVGVLGALCSHRRANLCLGSTTERGLRCRYHGWVYDATGRVLETPGEPPASALADRVQHPAYPAEELGGLVFVYLGPRPAPLLPRFDFLAGEGEHRVKITGFADCNWLQAVENGMDPLHVSYTHGPSWEDLNATPEMGFEETEWGLVHKAARPTRRPGIYNYREHHLLLPNISSGGSAQRMLDGPTGTPPTSHRWSVPIDDTHTMMVRVLYKPADNHGTWNAEPLVAGWKPIRIEPYLEYKLSDTPTLGYEIPRVIAAEDAAVMASMPPIVDREHENLLTVGDVGMRWIRNMYLQAIADVQAGRDPKGTVRDPARNTLIPVPCYEQELTADALRQRNLATVS
ncbi:MAG TPA: Rieske 2Fe-2S domain-containing protein [Chloroflexota bacterium]|nr:Rieske 2Fe-2S domain-containing protein [Chloroflexota bacterium]